MFLSMLFQLPVSLSCVCDLDSVGYHWPNYVFASCLLSHMIATAEYASSGKNILVALNIPHRCYLSSWQTDDKLHKIDGAINCNSETPWATSVTQIFSPLLSPSFYYLLSSSPSSVYPARLSCPATTARAASSVSRAAIKTWARRTNSQMMNTARSRSARSVGAPCSARTGGAATVATTGRGTARWIATAWCLSSALGLVDAFCLRWK